MDTNDLMHGVLSEPDSGYDNETRSLYTSIGSSILDYEETHGRFYHAFKRGRYPIPNDAIEQDRMIYHHQSIRTLLRRWWLSPCQPTRILDVGTGTGLWAIEVADEISNAQVTGIDLSPIQPNVTPPNLYFEVMDAEDQWNGFEESFDLIHTQFMNGISIRTWQPFYKQAITSLLPGGWVENHEIDFNCLCEGAEVPPENAFGRWIKLWNDGLEKLGMTGRCNATTMEGQLREEGFVNVTVESHRVPIGAWSTDNDHKRAGSLFLEGLLNDISGLSLKAFLDGLHWSRADLEVLLWEVRRDLQECELSLYMPFFVLTGQKPLRIQS